jgi:hypothetical protein
MNTIGHSKDSSFKLFTHCAVEGGSLSVYWSTDPQDGKGTYIQLTEDFIRRYLGDREISDATNIYILVDDQGNFKGFKSKMVESYLTKESGFEFSNKSGLIIAGQIYVPFADTPFADWGVRLNFNVDQDIPEPFTSTEYVATSVQAFHDFTYKQFPDLEVAGVEELSGAKRISVQLKKAGAAVKKQGVRVFAKCSSGYLPHTEAYTDANGIAKFKAMPLGLDTGETMEVQFGFKWVTNLERTTVVA